MRLLLLRWAPVASVLLWGCTLDQSVVDQDNPGSSFFDLSGSVEVDPQALGSHQGGAIAWFWDTDQGRGSSVEQVPFEARILSYVMTVTHPPGAGELSAGTAAPELPRLGVDGSRLLFGIPLLLAFPEEASGPLPAADLAALASWIDGGIGAFSELIPPAAAASPEVVGVTWEFLLIGLASDADIERYGDLPGRAGVPAGPLDDVVPGLTLYLRSAQTGGPWRPLSEPGTVTTFQSVTMIATNF